MEQATAVGDVCIVDSDCKIDNSLCISNTCQCIANYISSSTNRKCLKVANKMHEECDEDIQCEVGLNKTYGLVSCITFFCSCRIGATEMGGRCQGRSGIGGKCVKHHDCKVPLSFCQQGVCICPSDMEPSPEDDRCVEVRNSSKSFNTNCSFHAMCSYLGEHGHCYNSVCSCKPGYHMVDDQDQVICIQNRKLGDYCEKSHDCFVPDEREMKGLRECKKHKCACVKGYTATRDDACVSSSVHLKPSLFAALIFFLIVILK